ncbi:LuxR C-terminal-related transcriptional regulator [Adhaeribacter radiodurans]|uniref:Response regulator transcription factor n=1 Tax=Adhaeribacter radiodurans TaxID=2745197 RepID=A0A7L7LEY6_9BACT|nr:LuxR C-terminal-related transcriptional regulator [Adhaeribacter radiodurans]QMU31045.1 response regulator transcription factor [Adhaeribacter radiodurans]
MQNLALDLKKALKLDQHPFLVSDNQYQQQLANHPLVKNLWTIGHFFVIVSNLSTWHMGLVHGDCEEVSGYSAAEILAQDAEFSMQFGLPEDTKFNILVTQLGMQYFKSRPVEERELIFFVYFYRARRKDGKIITVQHQCIPLYFDEDKIPFVFSNIYTDISYLGVTQVPQALQMNRYTQEIFHINPQSLQFNKSEEVFSARERDIIKLLLKGYSSRLIAESLCISQETVRTHRKNILKKAGLNSTVELTGYVLTHGVL